jgi:hypothetical protein
MVMRLIALPGCAAALVLSLAAPAVAEQTNKPASSVPRTVGTSAGATINLLRPDFRGFPDGQYIFVMNGGDKDYTGPLDVKATCKPATPNPPANACGPNFPNGTYTHHEAKFAQGHGPAVAPVKGSGNAQQVSGYGWQAYYMGLPAGTFEITILIDPRNKVAESNEGNNFATKTITIPPSAPPGGIILNPTAVPVLRPTRVN